MPQNSAENPTDDWLAICDSTCGRETLLYSISLALFVLAILTFVLIIRETFPLLDAEDKTLLRSYWVGTKGIDIWRKRDRAITACLERTCPKFPEES